jgi:hypothetical protein
MGTSVATEFLGEAVLIILAAAAGILALQSAATLLQQRRLIAVVVARRIRGLIPKGHMTLTSLRGTRSQLSRSAPP